MFGRIVVILAILALIGWVLWKIAQSLLVRRREALRKRIRQAMDSEYNTDEKSTLDETPKPKPVEDSDYTETTSFLEPKTEDPVEQALDETPKETPKETPEEKVEDVTPETKISEPGNAEPQAGKAILLEDMPARKRHREVEVA